jgi:hypothetical protein
MLICLLLIASLGCEPATPAPAPPTAAPPPIPTLGSPATPAATPQQVAGSAADRFIAAYKQANASKDLEAALRLYCFDGASPEMRETVRGNVKDELLQTVDTIEITQAAGLSETTADGYRANLKPVAQVKVTYKPGGVNITEQTFGVGMKGGQYLIPVLVR